MIVQWIVLILLASSFLHYGRSQCYTDTTCSGSTVSASDLRSCCVDTNDGLAFNDSTTCTVCIVHGFEQATYDVDENSRLDTEFRLNVKGSTDLSFFLSGTITAEAAGTSVPNDFQQIAPITVSGTTSVRVFTLNDDVTLEYDDRISLSFTTDNPTIISGLQEIGQFLRQNATINIIDKDLLEINFGESDLTIAEGSTMLSTPMRLEFRATQNPFTVTLSPVSIAVAESKGLGIFWDSDIITDALRATAGADFTENAIIIEVPANLRSYDISTFFNITADNIDEDEQSFAVLAEIGQDVPDNISCFQIVYGQTGCTTDRRGAIRIRITDIDPMIIGFTARSTTVGEDDGPLGFDTFPLSIQLSTLRRAERQHAMTIRHQEAISNATVIAANEEFGIFDAKFGSRSDPNNPITYNAVLGELEDSFNPILVLIRNNLSPEPFECFSLRITPDDVRGRRELFSCNEDCDNATSYFCDHTLCIIDNDDPFEVTFVKTTYTVPETVGAVEICVNLTKPPVDILDETVNVFGIDFRDSIYIPENSFVATPETPDFFARYFMTNGTDYSEQTFAINELDDIIITQTMRIICYNQTIYNDIRLEPGEYFGMTLGVRDNAMTTVFTIVKPLFDQLSVLILDDDYATIGLEETLNNVLEGAGHVEICAVVLHPIITCPVEFNFDIFVNITDGTAVYREDYNHSSPVTISFDTCETRACTQVEILTDKIYEDFENFYISLESSSEPANRILFERSDGVINITDYVAEVVLEQEVYQVTEGDNVTVCAVLNILQPNLSCIPPFTLYLSTNNEFTMDYKIIDNLFNFTVSTDCNQTRRCIDINILDDEFVEMMEIVPLVLKNSSDLIDRLHLLTSSIIINNTDYVEISLEQSMYAVHEDDEFLTICAEISSDSTSVFGFALNLSITFTSESTGDIEARELLSFAEGDSRTCIRISVDDEMLENVTEIFSLSLERPPDLESSITLSQHPTILNITDNDNATVGLEQTFYTVDESILRVVVVVTSPSVSCPVQFPFTILLSTRDITAVSGMDYVGLNRYPVHFAECQKWSDVNITIVDDEILENVDKTFSLELERPNALDSRISLDPANGTVEIIDNDLRGVGLEHTVYNVTEGVDTALVCVVINSSNLDTHCPIAFSFNLSITTIHSSADIMMDYFGLDYTIVSFLSCQNQSCINIPIIDDEVTEVLESFSLTLESSPDLDPRISVTTDTATVNIIDDDDLEIEFESANITEGHDLQVEVCAVIQQPAENCSVAFPFDVFMYISDDSVNTAEAGSDYRDKNMTIPSQCQKEWCITILILDDDVPENKETLRIMMDIPHPRITNPQPGLIRINDNDDMFLGFTANTYTGREMDGKVTVCVEITNIAGALRNFNVSILPEQEKEVSSKQLSVQCNKVLSFATNDKEVCHSYAIEPDDVCELKNDETRFDFQLFLSSTIGLDIDPDMSQTTVVIDDSREPECNVRVGFVQTSYEVSDSDDFIEVCVESNSLGIALDFDITVNTTDKFVIPLFSNLSLNFTVTYENRTDIQCFNSSDVLQRSTVCDWFSSCNDLSVTLELKKTNESDLVMIRDNSTQSQFLITPPSRCGCQTQNSLTLIIIVSVLAAIGVLTLAAVIILIIYLYRKKKKLGEHTFDEQYELNEDHTYMLIDETKRSILSAQLKDELKQRRMVFSKDQLHLADTVGQGESGQVYRAYLDTAVGKELVAVKTGKALFSTTDIKRLGKEISTMLSFEHEHVMSLLGVCLDGEMPLLIMPFMTNGSLLDFVKKHKKEYMCLDATLSICKEARKSLLSMCYQIAQGMEYLSGNKFVHRDLAARNCMIDRKGIIKVADFGLTEDMYGTNYFRRRKSVVSEEKVPIRWMAPESIESDIYTEATDVWAYGVTMWEVFTCGMIPYPGIPAMSLRKMLQRGERLEIPDNKACNGDVYDIMMQCWQLDPEERPVFSELVTRLSDILETTAGYLDLSHSLCINDDPQTPEPYLSPISLKKEEEDVKKEEVKEDKKE